MSTDFTHKHKYILCGFDNYILSITDVTMNYIQNISLKICLITFEFVIL